MQLLLIWADDRIRNLRQLDALLSETYTLTVIVAVLALVIAIGIAESIAYQGGKNPNDPAKRRVSFFVVGLVATVVFFLFNYLYVKQSIDNVSLQAKFVETNIVATVLVAVLYVATGFVLSKAWKNSKFGTIFPRKR